MFPMVTSGWSYLHGMDVGTWQEGAHGKLLVLLISGQAQGGVWLSNTSLMEEIKDKVGGGGQKTN